MFLMMLIAVAISMFFLHMYVKAAVVNLLQASQFKSNTTVLFVFPPYPLPRGVTLHGNVFRIADYASLTY